MRTSHLPTPPERPVPSDATDPSVDDALLLQIEREYREMPGLCLTARQAGRLWQLTPPHAAALLDHLVEVAVLMRTPQGAYGLRTSRP